MNGRRRTIRHRRGGYAMLAVLLFLAVSLVFVSVNQQRLSSMLLAERACGEAEQFDQGAVRAMARAIELLETGLPPSDPYVCQVTLDTPAGSRSFRVQFTSPESGQWSISVEPLAPLDSLPPLPVTFAH